MNITIQILILMVSSISYSWRGIFDIKKAKSAFDSIFNLLGIINEIDHKPEENVNKIKPDNIEGKVEFKNVYFKYPIQLDDDAEIENPLLDRVNIF